MRTRNGFTPIERLVVIAIIGILAAIRKMHGNNRALDGSGYPLICISWHWNQTLWENLPAVVAHTIINT